MATYSSILAWKIPWTDGIPNEEPGRLRSMGSQRVRHDWVTSLSLSPLTLSISASQAINLLDSVASASQAILYCKFWQLRFWFFFLSIMQILDLNFDCWSIHFKKATIKKTTLSNKYIGSHRTRLRTRLSHQTKPPLFQGSWLGLITDHLSCFFFFLFLCFKLLLLCF